jgi:UDP-glucose 4-epimerase
MTKSSSKVLVTGAAGFIGRHVVAALLTEGHEVYGVDNLSSDNAQKPLKQAHFQWIPKNLHSLSPKDLPAKIDCVVHLAARPSVETSWSDPLEAHRENLTSLLQVLEWRRALSIPRVILASSAAVYGRPVALPVGEDHPLAPMSPYGLHKKAAEDYLSLFAAREDFSATSLRFFNVFGPGQSPKSPYSGVMSIFVDRLRTGKEIVLHGSGKQTRDFIHVGDVAQAVVCAVGAALKPGHRALNIGTGKKVSIVQLLAELEKAMGVKAVRVARLPARAGDIPHSVASVARARRVLGFRARTGLEAGVRDLCRALAVKGA